jgi:predicted  nucleic acid-binding Zn-ribbon protein
MVTSVFLKAGMDSLSASEIKGSLRLVLQQARTAYAKNNQDAVVAERAANAICSRISALVADLLSRDDDDASKSIRHLEKEIESLSTSLNSLNGHCGIAQLIQNRDVQKQVADKASTVVNIAMGSVPNNNAPLVQVSSVTKDEVLLSLVGEDGLEQMNANKSAHDAIRQKMKDAETRSSPEYQTLKQNLVAFQDELADITKKMEELKNALKLLEEKDAVLCEKIQGAEKDIAALDESSNGEMAKLQKELAVTSKATESDVSVRTLADRLAMYETTAKQTISTSSFAATNGDEDMSNVVPGKMNSYLIRARNYFRSEADCVQFLRGRVRTLETEANSLVSFMIIIYW